MTTFTASKTPHTFVRGSEALSQLSGDEGQELNRRISNVAESIYQTESVKRLIQALTDENIARQEELERYLSSLHSEIDSAGESSFANFVANYSWQVWLELSRYFLNQGLCLEVPDACPGQDNDLMYTWSKAEHYLECEIFGDGAVEFFYRNRKSGEVWGEDTKLENGLSTSVLEKVSIFAW